MHRRQDSPEQNGWPLSHIAQTWPAWRGRATGGEEWDGAGHRCPSRASGASVPGPPARASCPWRGAAEGATGSPHIDNPLLTSSIVVVINRGGASWGEIVV